jgi:MFS family permease
MATPPLSSATAHRDLAGGPSKLHNGGMGSSPHPDDDDDDEERERIGCGSARDGDDQRAPPLLSIDGKLLMAARFVRLFSYGWLAVGLILYLSTVGFSQFQIGALFSVTLLGDLLVTFWLSTSADSLGRRSTLLASSLLKVFGGCTYAFLHSFVGLIIAGFIGIVSPTGGEIGPFLAIEQAGLTEAVTRNEDITKVFGYYQMIGYLGQALGALASGVTMSSLQSHHGWDALDAYRFVIVAYALFGLIMFGFYWFLSSDIEPLHTREAGDVTWASKFGLHRPESRRIVFKLSLLFILDAYAGGQLRMLRHRSRELSPILLC